jgi:hypothetical protein
VLTHVGDATAAQFFAGMDGFVYNDDAFGPSRVLLDEVKGGGCAGRAGADDENVYFLDCLGHDAVFSEIKVIGN